jgi:hypothetical protein
MSQPLATSSLWFVTHTNYASIRCVPIKPGPLPLNAPRPCLALPMAGWLCPSPVPCSAACRYLSAQFLCTRVVLCGFVCMYMSCAILCAYALCRNQASVIEVPVVCIGTDGNEYSSEVRFMSQPLATSSLWFVTHTNYASIRCVPIKPGPLPLSAPPPCLALPMAGRLCPSPVPRSAACRYLCICVRDLLCLCVHVCIRTCMCCVHALIPNGVHARFVAIQPGFGY